MQIKTKLAKCMYCGTEELINKHAKTYTHKCINCFKIWHKLRVRHDKFGENTTLNDLVMWHITQPQKCVECGSTKKLTIDRIIPNSKGGKYELSNIQLLCYSCNSCKKKQFLSVKEGIKGYTTKECSVCYKILPLTTEYFHKTNFKPVYIKHARASFRPVCKKCRLKSMSLDYMKKNKPTRLKKIKYLDNYQKLYGKI